MRSVRGRLAHSHTTAPFPTHHRHTARKSKGGHHIIRLQGDTTE